MVVVTKSFPSRLVWQRDVRVYRSDLLAREHEKIILFPTHRYDTIRQADTIVVLVDGRLAESGTPAGLERAAGAFWSLYLGQGSRIVRGNSERRG
jgi:ABC-type multidrug transport system fused ATPase/permease subunit